MGELLDRLAGRVNGFVQTGPDKGKFLRPDRSDKNPSVHAAEIEGASGEKMLVIHDFSGWSTVDVLAGYGLEFADLYPEKLNPYKPGKPIKRPAFSCSDALRGINHESYIVLIMAHEIARGGGLSGEALERLELSIDRIHTARSLVLKYG